MANSFDGGFQRSEAQDSYNDYQQPSDPVQSPRGWIPASAEPRILPTLRPQEMANRNDGTLYAAGSPTAKLYEDAQPAIVRITGNKDMVINGRNQLANVTGSGFFLTPDGRLATDLHVVQDVRNLQVKTADGHVFSAKIENVDPAHDLAILSIERASQFQTFKVLPLGASLENLAALRDNSDGVPGLLALGYPRGWEPMFASPGQFSTTKLLRDILRKTRDGVLANEDPNRVVLEAEMHTEPGDSGGPVVDKKGRVVGIVGLTDEDNSAKVTTIATPVEDLVQLLSRTQRIGGSTSVDTAGTFSLGLPRGVNLPSYGDFGAKSLVPNATGTSDLGTGPSFFSRPSVPAGDSGTAPQKDSGIAPQKDAAALPLADLGTNTAKIKPVDVPSLSHSLMYFNNVWINTMSPTTLPRLTGVVSILLGGSDAIHDWTKFQESRQSGSTKEILWNGAQLLADGLLIAGGAAYFSRRYATAGASACLTGSVFKLLGDGVGYYRHFR